MVNSKVQEIVDQVKASGCLGNASRQSDLLWYLLTEKEQGRLNRITQFSVAVDVLGRNESFDSKTDSIVRVEMHRLRNNLKLFNGTSKKLHLKIPRASYKVTVNYSPKKQEFNFFGIYLNQLAITASAFVVLVTGFLLTQTPTIKSLAIASSCSSIIPNIRVINIGNTTDLQTHVGRIIRSTVSQYTNVNLVEDIQACNDSGTPSFTLELEVLGENSKYHVGITTYHSETLKIIKHTNIGGLITPLEGKTNLHFDIIKSIDELVKPYGIVPKYAITIAWNNPTYMRNYRCLITMYDSFSSGSSEEYTESLSCLEASAETNVSSLDNLGGLAASYLEQAQGYRAKTVNDPLLEAEKIISRAGDEWINSVEMTIAKMIYEVERPDFNNQRLKALLRDAENRYDIQPQILLMVAVYSGYKLGDWEYAKRISDKVKLLHAEQDNSVYVIDAAYALLFETPDKSMQVCKKLYSENSLIANLIVNACSKQSQDIYWFQKTQENLERLNYASTELQVNFIKNKDLESSFSNELILALNLPPI